MSIFMKIDKLDAVKGGATIPEIDKKKGLFKLDSTSWGAVRGTSIELVNANNSSNGNDFAMDDVTFSAESRSLWVMAYVIGGFVIGDEDCNRNV